MPTATNSMCSALTPWRRKVSRVPTTPSAPTAAASAIIRAIALVRAVYIAWLSTPSSTDWLRFWACQPMW